MGEYVEFDGGNSTDNVGVVNYTWSFKDDHPVTLHGMKTKYQFYNPGIFEVLLNVSDAWKNWNTDTITVIVEDRTSPVANAGSYQIIDEGEYGEFVGVESSDNAGITNYTWTFEDGELVTLYGSQARYLFDNPGLYNITLKVSDDAGNWDTDTFSILVNDITDPDGEAGPDAEILCDEEITLDGSGSTDNVGIMNCTWTFSYDSRTVNLYGTIHSFVFDIPGEYTILLTVKDEAGLKNSDTVVITVIDGIPPIADVGSDRVIGVGYVLYLDGSLSNDNDLIEKYFWTFEYQGEDRTLNGENVSFVFDSSGVYEIRLVVTDRYGNTDEDGFVVTVVGEGIIKGRVLDENGNPLSGAIIAIALIAFAIILVQIGISIFFVMKKRKDSGKIGNEEVEDPFTKSERLSEICRSNNIQISMLEINYSSAMQQKKMGMEEAARTRIRTYNNSVESMLRSKGINTDTPKVR